MRTQSSGVDVLADPENIRTIGNILKTNVAACSAIGPYFLPQLGRLWVDMLGLYGAASNNVSEAVAQQGKSCDLGRLMIAKLMGAFPSRSCCYSNSQGSSASNDQEGDSQAGRDLHQAG